MSNCVSKIDNEKKTVQIMVTIFCNKKHNTRNELCSECSSLLEYAFKRLDNCKFGNNKGACGKCKIHCYKLNMREKIKKVMRFAGPRMLYTHPLLAVKHLIDGRKK